MNKTKTIYFDESGFTGDHLLNIDQPVFVYASVAIEPIHASYLHSEAMSRYALKGTELKGNKLVGHHRGQECISWLLNECKGHALISVSNKKYALAGKFFEYIFEPVLAAQNSLFYKVGFHKFIATLLYILFETKDEYAENIMKEFEALVRKGNPRKLESLLSPIDGNLALSDPLGQILTFTLCHRERIEREILGLGEASGLNKWTLELTLTSLHCLLSAWSESFDCMEVYCDESKPLETDRNFFDPMIGRTDRVYVTFDGQKESALTYNLSGSIKLVKSHEYHGVQIADVIASSLAHAYRYPASRISKEWLALASDMLSGACIIPDKKNLDLNLEEPFINAVILHELVDRTIKGKSLLDGMADFIVFSKLSYKTNPPFLRSDK